MLKKIHAFIRNKLSKCYEIVNKDIKTKCVITTWKTAF